ncbi:surface protease GP63 [Trypanosoma cruzi]|nr:surface protease GP63 [Trypanosoma cruzi]
MPEDGGNAQPHETHRLMVGAAGQHPNVSGQFGNSTSPSLVAFALPRLPLEDGSGAEEEEQNFLAFDVTTWATRIRNEGISGAAVDLWGAYNYYWHQADDQVQLALDSLLSWMHALEMDRDPADRFTDLGKILLQVFWLQIMVTTANPASRSPHFAPAFTWLSMKLKAARERLSLSRNDEQPNKSNDHYGANCVTLKDPTHRHATRAPQPEGITRSAGGRQKTAR